MMDGREPEFFKDDTKFIHDMLKECWDTSPVQPPVFAYVPEQMVASARTGMVYVYPISRYNSSASTDYRILQRTSFLAIRTSCRSRDVLHLFVDEVYRIMYEHRRVGQAGLNGYTFLEVINDRSSNELSGWYSNTLDVKLTTYNHPIQSDGFGSRGNDCL